MGIKKRFKEERNNLELDKKKLTVSLEEARSRLEIAESKFYAYKKEVDESPLNVLRNELSLKNVDILELESKLK